MRRLLLVAALGFGGILATGRAEPALAARTAFDTFVYSNCIRCHNTMKAEADLDLSRRDLDWRRIRRVLRRRSMPPAAEPRPSDAEYGAALRAVRTLRGPVSLGPPPPVTIRRLNRAEYENTVRDLLGVDFDASATFPADEVGHGFDNVGAVLSLPPALLEKYLDAAERIAARAVVDENPPPPGTHRYEGRGMRLTQGANHQGPVAHMFAPSEAWVTHEFPRAGEYEFVVHAYGQQAGAEVVKLALRVDRRALATIDVPAVRAKPGVYKLKVRVRGGARRVALAFVNDFYRPNHPDPKQRDRNAIVAGLEIRGPVDKAVLPLSQRIVLPEPPPKTGGERYLANVVGRLAERAWRRPVASSELRRLLQVVYGASGEDATVEARVRVAITALLTSPHFLFRVEAPDAAGGRRRDDFELASRLSYFLWSSMPDDDLFATAYAGLLDDDAEVERHVVRMLKDARASSLAHRFAPQWLQIGRLDAVTPDPTLFPAFNDAVRAAARAETELLFEAILREDRSVWELLDTDFTFVNEPLAKLYGLAG
ncbi:MAG: DUF1592 domain-containing protein, partial [Planctomycetota bacterium]|nr:DUF1592 domain-containing protein [Planctomycetota bacterium]